ncbi:MAG: hypothetical protein EA387_10370, partial [Nitriliruptor sp.]
MPEKLIGIDHPAKAASLAPAARWCAVSAVVRRPSSTAAPRYAIGVRAGFDDASGDRRVRLRGRGACASVGARITAAYRPPPSSRPARAAAPVGRRAGAHIVAEVELPQLGESVEEGIITAWLVEVGDTVEVDQPIVEIST